MAAVRFLKCVSISKIELLAEQVMRAAQHLPEKAAGDGGLSRAVFVRDKY